MIGNRQIFPADCRPGVLARDVPNALSLRSRVKPQSRKHNRTLIGMGLVITMLTGCAVGPDFRPPEAPDVTGYIGRGDNGGRVEARVVAGDLPYRWWELFRSKPLSRLIEEGIQYNADLKAAEASIRVAYANAKASRGSQFPAVVAPWSTAYSHMLSRALLYTAVTRAQRLCVLVGERRALAMALGRVEQRRRHSGLVERIIDR